MDTLISGGTIVSADIVEKRNILIRGEKIISVEDGSPDRETRIIDARGMYVVPGGVDVHTHLGMTENTGRTGDDWYSGTVAAACGGTTTVVDHPEFGPKGCRLLHQMEVYHGLADDTSVIDYSFHGVVQHVDRPVINDLQNLITGGITSSKLYMTYEYRVEDADILRFLSRMKELAGLTAIHCENHAIITYMQNKLAEERKVEPWNHPLSRPVEAEAEAVNRVIILAGISGNSPLYIVHVSTAAATEEIRQNKKSNPLIFAETCPQYLLLTEEKYHEPDSGGLKYIMSPPLRKQEDSSALWDALKDGTIQTVATDHCPFQFETKKELAADNFLQCPNGAPGIETRMPLLFSEGVAKKRLSIQRFVEVTSTNPAKLMGLYPRKGTIAVGSDADIVLFDPQKTIRLNSCMLHQADYTPFEGVKVIGYPILTMLRGKVIAKNNEFTGAKGDGLFLKRGTYQSCV